jgi:hypothetical protein
MPRTPPLRRRLLCMLYEGVLLFGVLMAASAVYILARPLLQQVGLDRPMSIRPGCSSSWPSISPGSGNGTARPWPCRPGASGSKQRPVPRPVAASLFRFALAWLWLPPAATVGHALGLTKGPFIGVLAIGLLIWISLAWLDPRRRFLHDRLAGTRLVDLRPSKP